MKEDEAVNLQQADNHLKDRSQAQPMIQFNLITIWKIDQNDCNEYKKTQGGS